ncbi:hypothetical protein RHECNPAF_25300124 [Rhizobium etli CNPAF512]|nr:hypothetical protein RHECNPAF_25300124 [Rhizobium etli CNPAF512]
MERVAEAALFYLPGFCFDEREKVSYS